MASTTSIRCGSTQRHNNVSSEDLIANVRSVLVNAGNVREVKMFGGTGFMLNGNLLVGASQRGLLVRVGKEGQREALARPGASPMVMRGRTMDGYIRVAPQALSDAAVRAWVHLAVRFVATLPPKAPGSRRKSASTKRK